MNATGSALKAMAKRILPQRILAWTRGAEDGARDARVAAARVEPDATEAQASDAITSDAITSDAIAPDATATTADAPAPGHALPPSSSAVPSTPASMPVVGPVAAQPAAGLTLGGLVVALWRRKVAIASFTVLAALVTLAVLVSIRPQYESSARVLIEPAAGAVPTDMLGGVPSRERVVLDREAIASQVELIRSRDVALRVIEALDLTSRLEFASPGALESLLAIFGIAPDEATLLEQAVQTYSDGLSVFHIPETRVIGIAFRAHDPELAAQVANAVAQGYLDEQVSDRSTATQATNDWLGDEIERLRGRVAIAERRVQGFRAEAGLIRGVNDTTLPAQRLSELNTQIAEARSSRIDAEGRADQIRRAAGTQANAGLAGAAAATPLMQRLLERQGEARARLADLSTTLGPAHPRIRQLEAQVADIASQVGAEARRLAAALDEEARTAQAREATLQDELATLQAEAADAEYQDVELRALEREAKAQRDLLETLLARFRETSARQNPAAMPADARIISSASVPLEPAFPKLAPTLIAATLAAFLLACGTTVTNALVRQAPAPAAASPFPPARFPPSWEAVGSPASSGERAPTHPASGAVPTAGAEASTRDAETVKPEPVKSEPEMPGLKGPEFNRPLVVDGARPIGDDLAETRDRHEPIADDFEPLPVTGDALAEGTEAAGPVAPSPQAERFAQVAAAFEAGPQDAPTSSLDAEAPPHEADADDDASALRGARDAVESRPRAHPDTDRVASAEDRDASTGEATISGDPTTPPARADRPRHATSAHANPAHLPRDVRTGLSLDEIAAMLAAGAARPCILVVAPGAPVGAMTGLVLADAIALLGTGTLCIDMAALHPAASHPAASNPAVSRDGDSLADVVGLPDAAGLGDLGAGADYDDVLHAVPGSPAHVLLAGRAAPRPHQMPDALDLLHEAYEVLVLVADLRVLEGHVPDAEAILARVTGTVLLSDGCSAEMVAHHLARLAAAGLDDVTIVSAESAVPPLRDAA